MERGLETRRGLHIVSAPPQQVGQRPVGIFMILDQQNAHALTLRSLASNCRHGISVRLWQVGKARLNLVPLLRPVLSAVMDPLCASTSVLLIARPRPRPPNCVLVPCSNASKIFGRVSGSIPSPVSAISTCNCSSESLPVEI